uniref:SURP motif domain-containing protein n=2 Tax=Mesocestoides corti TaxID=53468 RepID=A0A5K3EYE7_MESCO
MSAVQSGDLDDLQVVGFKCSLFNDPEKSLEVNNGKLLVPWGNDRSLIIDRFDCRGYLQNVSEYDADNIVRRVRSQTSEDVALEEMCDYERYLELRTDIHEMAILQEEVAKREVESSKSSYSAVGFSYEETKPESEKSPKELESSDIKEAGNKSDKNPIPKEQDDEPYVCPPDLVLPLGTTLPDFERQAAIIEKTALFIARNNVQMEIVLKTKQAGNPQFNFLNYDDKLNPFYKEMVRLIKIGRYIPRRRPTVDTSESSKDASNPTLEIDEPYELKLPKVDISTTAYASLINRFKKSASEKLNGTPKSTAESLQGSAPPSPASLKETSETAAPGDGADKVGVNQPPEMPVMSEADYERCYQEYYRYYYSHYYLHFTNSEATEATDEAWLVSESARAAATAASAAVNAMRQSHLPFNSCTTSPSSEVRGIIDKMAEYVARNGEEFQEVVRKQKQNDSRFAFLQSGHLFHEYYLAKKKEFIAAMAKNKDETGTESPSLENGRDSKTPTPKEEKNGTTKPRVKGISFRLTKSASSSRLKGMEESSPSPNATGDEPPCLRASASCNVLPGMSNYSSETESESEEEKVSPQPSPSLRPRDEETTERTSALPVEVPTVSFSTSPRVPAPVSPSSRKSPTPPPPSKQEAPINPRPTATNTPPLTSSTLTSEEIARDIQSMEEQARLQLERRKRAALFAAKLQQAKLLQAEREAEEERRRRALAAVPPPPLPPTATAAPPPPPSSVPAAVAHAVVAQLKTQREKALEAAAADSSKKTHGRSKRSPPAAYTKRRRRSSRSSPHDRIGGSSSSRSRRRRSRSTSHERERGHSKKRQYRKSSQYP